MSAGSPAGYAYIPTEDAAKQALPLKILVVGAFYPQDARALDAYPAPLMVSGHVGQLMALRPVGVTLPLCELVEPGPLCDLLAEPCLALSFRSLQDFGIESFSAQIPLVKAALSMRDALMRSSAVSAVEAATANDGSLAGWLGARGDFSPVLAAAELSEDINRLLNAIASHPEMRRVEASWLGLDLLASARPKGCQLAVLSLPMASLESDLSDNRDIRDSMLYEFVYSREYGQFGGIPYAAVLVDRAFGGSAQELGYLRKLGELGELIHAPVIVQASPEMLGVDCWETLISESRQQRPSSVQGLVTRIGSMTSRYIVLAAPAIVIRSSRRTENGGCSHPLFNENNSGLRLGSPVYVLGRILFESASRSGSFADIGGLGKTIVDVLPPVRVFDGQLTLSPLEVRFSQAMAAHLIQAGISPLVSVDSGMGFSALLTLAGARDTNDEHSRSDEGRLSYLFMILRMAHCLKVVGREAVGSNASLPEVESTLSRWLRQFVSEVELPSPDLKARRPLKQAAVRVHEDRRRPGVFSVELSMAPHSHHASAGVALGVSLWVGG
jgi:type VI secretion system protein ImpC